MKKIFVFVTTIALTILDIGWSSTDSEISEQLPSNSISMDSEPRTRFDCVAIGKCTVIDGGGEEVRHFANWSGDAPDRPTAINNVKAEWYRTARNRGCTKNFEIFLVSCQ